MEEMYREEMRQSIALLKANLESVPLARDARAGATGSSPHAHSRHARSRARVALTSSGGSGGKRAGIGLLVGLGRSPRLSAEDDSSVALSKLDIQLQFHVEVVVLEVRGLKSLPKNRIVYCTMQLLGRPPKLQTDQAEASKP